MHMKSALHSLITVIVIAVLFTSCSGKGPKEAAMIPKDVSAVVILDPGAMQDKLTKGGISIDTLVSRIFKNDSSDTKDKAKINEFRTNAGINWQSQLFFFVSQQSNNKDGNTTIINVMGGISDASKFETWLKKQDDLNNKTVVKESKYSYLLAEDNTMISWTDKNVLITVYSNFQKPSFDTVTMEYQVPEKKNVEEEMKKQVNTYYTLDKAASLSSVSAFTNMFKEKADGYIFTSSNSSLSAFNMLPLSLPKVEELLKDNYTASTLAFEDGRIIAKSTTYTNPMVSNILKEYAGRTVDLSMIERYPSNKINGFMLASFNPEIFGGFLKQLEVEGLVNGMMEKSGFTAQDLYKSLKGDIAVIVSDLGVQQPEPQDRMDEKRMTMKKPVGKMIFSAPVGDRNSFFKLMDKATELGYFIKNGNTYKSGELMKLFGIYMAADDKNCVIASDSLTYVQYMSNTGKAVIETDVLNRFKGKTSVVYFDIANTFAAFMNNNTGDYNQSLKTAKETFKDVIGTSGSFDGKSIKAEFEVRMQNEKQNSLVTLTSLITDVAVDMRIASKRQKELEDKMFPGGGYPAIIRTN